METFITKTRVLVWIIIGLAALNLATIVTVLVRTRQAEAPFYGNRNQGCNNQGFSGRAIRDQLQLTDEQMNQFRNINRPFREKAWQIADDIRRNKATMIDLMSRDDVDTRSLDALSDSIGSSHARLRREMVQYFLQLKAMCTPEQRTKLVELFKQQMPGDEMMGRGRGRGGRMMMNNGEPGGQNCPNQQPRGN